MPNDLWGASDTIKFGLPGGWQAYLIFFAYLALTAYFLYIYRHQFTIAWQQNRYWTIGLTIAAFISSQLLPLNFSFNVPMIGEQPIAALLLLAMIPLLLGSAILHPVAAFVVGMSSGLGRAMGQTHTALDIFAWGFTAVFLSLIMQQNYQGRVYKWARHPIIAALGGTVLLTLLSSLNSYVSLPLSGLAALDRTLVATRFNFWAFFIASVIAGLVVIAVLHNKPDLAPKQQSRPSPIKTSLKHRLISYYTAFAIIVIIAGTAIGYLVIINTSTQAYLNAMTINVNNATAMLAAQPPIVAIAAFTMSAATSHAASVNLDYSINTNRSTHFAFSYIHSADHFSRIGGVQYFNGGQLLFKLNGTLETTFDTVTGETTLRGGTFGQNFASGNAGTTVDLDAVVLTAAATNSATSGFVGAGDVGDTWTFRILSLNITDDELAPAGTSGSNGAHGTIEYEILDDSATPVMLTNGTYHFFDVAFGGFPSNLQDNSHGGNPIALWGNNWDNQAGADKPPVHLGIDLGGTVGSPVVVVPVPMAVWGGLSLLTAMGLIQIKRRSVADVV